MANRRQVDFARQAPHFGAFMELMIGAGFKLFKRKIPLSAKAMLLGLRNRAALSYIVSKHLNSRNINYTTLLTPLSRRHKRRGKNGGNVGVGCWLEDPANGIPKIITDSAHSKSSRISPKGNQPLHEALKPGLWPDKEKKIDCTEIQILNNFLVKNIDHGCPGELKLFTELFPCASCRGVISDFLKVRPQVSLHLYVELGALGRSNKWKANKMLKENSRLKISSLAQNTR